MDEQDTSILWPPTDNVQVTSPSAAEIRQQLERIVGSGVFRASLRLRRFISFVVETALAGRNDRIKAYSIATEALGRDPAFDPQTDPIVRVEAGRLRQALGRYYAGAGRDDPLVIDLPRGTYVPAFRRPPSAPSAERRSGQSASVFSTYWSGLLALRREG